MNFAIVQFARLSEAAREPVKPSSGAAGVDLFSSVSLSITARGRAVVATDIAIALPRSTYGRIASLSDLAVNHGIDVGAGVVDQEYRDGIDVILFNHSDEEFQIAVGDRIARLVVESTRDQIYMREIDPKAMAETPRGGGQGLYRKPEKSR